MVAMRPRHAGVGGAGQRGGDARHHFEGDAVRVQELQLLAAAPEHEGVAALEPHHAAAGARMLQHQRVDAVLADVVVGGLLAHFDELGVAARQRQHAGADQAVVQDHVGLVEQAQRTQREQARIARTGADERDRADVA